MTLAAYLDARELLLASVTAETIRHWLVPLGFEDWQGAHRRLLRIAERGAAQRTFGDLLPYLLSMLAETGNSTGAHLHFEIRYQGGFVNPWYVLPAP